MAQAVAAKVKGVVMTSSPGFRSKTARARCIAEVPESRATAYLDPQYAANSCSKASTSGPRIKLLLSIAVSIAARISFFKGLCCGLRSR